MVAAVGEREAAAAVEDDVVGKRHSVEVVTNGRIAICLIRVELPLRMVGEVDWMSENSRCCSWAWSKK